MDPNPDVQSNYPDRWTLMRDLFVFQAKLFVDGLRDLLLVPASLLAGIWSLVSGDKGRPGPQFYQLIRVGKQSELWIDLFKACVTAQAKERIDKALDAIQRSRTP
jgi:hypothetical protein